MHHCPGNAIAFGILTQGPYQYTFVFQDSLFEKVSINQQAYWQQFKRTRKK